MTKISNSDLQIIAAAKQALENESIAMRISKIASMPVDGLLGLLPDAARKDITEWANASLEKATQWAMVTTGTKSSPFLREDWMHKIAVVVSGAGGGFGGIASTAAELPVSTMLMLRSIGCVAEEEGHDITDRKIRLGCVSVLAMGADPEKVDKDELGYWIARKAMAGMVTQAAEWSGRGSVPALAKFIVEVAKKFGVVVSAKAAAQLAPLAGSLGGAGINYLFLDHYQAVAHAHFAIERLCLKYGEAAVRAAYRTAT
jgi:methylglyoxal synthase